MVRWNRPNDDDDDDDDGHHLPQGTEPLEVPSWLEIPPSNYFLVADRGAPFFFPFFLVLVLVFGLCRGVCQYIPLAREIWCVGVFWCALRCVALRAQR